MLRSDAVARLGVAAVKCHVQIFRDLRVPKVCRRSQYSDPHPLLIAMSTVRVFQRTIDGIILTMVSQVVPTNPKQFLQQLTGQNVYVRLKWGQDYTGFLVSTDGFMNILVSPAAYNQIMKHLDLTSCTIAGQRRGI